MIEICTDRLMADLRTLASFGAYKTGVHRPSLSSQDMQARHWLAGRMSDAGLVAEIDGIGNVIGRWPGDGPRVLSGSHLESQNRAGWLDGAMGVVYALEAARAVKEAAGSRDVGVDVIAFCDEEGHFASFLGSRSFTGRLSDEQMAVIVNRETGQPLAAALEEAGLAGRPRQQLEPGRYRAFMEAHIEQGPTLESQAIGIGVVTAVVAIRQYRLVAVGQQNHAGTTRMSQRRDAGLELVRLLAAIDRRFPEIAGPDSVWTTGQLMLDPNARSIVPGRAEASFQFRDVDSTVLQRLDESLHQLVAEAQAGGRCQLSIEKVGASQPALMDRGLQACIARAAEGRRPGDHLGMPSGAGHDAQWLANELPTAMMFVPSIGGVSHHWSENTHDADLVHGARVFVDAVADVLGL